LLEESKKMLDNAKNMEALKQAVMYNVEQLKKRNIPDSEITKFRQYANKLREKFTQPQTKEEIQNETR
jgi:hypothetical protein